MIILDTNILIEVFKGNATIFQKLQTLEADTICITHITTAELIYGARNRKELRAIKEDLDGIRQLPINEKISERAVELVETFSLSHNLNLPDA